MKKRVISAILSLSVLSASISVVPSVKVLGAEETNTPGIEQWGIPSGTIQTIEGVEFDDFITSFGEDAYIYYTDNKRILVVMSDGNMRHFTNGSINSSYSVVTMREGTEPPVKEINEKIGSGDDVKVIFYKYTDSDEYRFDVLNTEYKDMVFDMLKNDRNVLSIENRREIIEDEFRLENLYVSAEITSDEIINEYEAFDLKLLETIPETVKEQGYNLGFKFDNYKLNTPELYETFMKLKNSGINYKIEPLFAFESGGVGCVMSENVYTAEENDSCGDINLDCQIDVTDLSELSLALIGDRKLSEAQQKAADVDKDGKVTLSDLARMRQYLSKIITSFG